MKQYFGYIRVSTARQGEGVSLQEQRAAIERFALRNGLAISEWFEEKETAAKRGRPVWSAMLRLLKRGKAEGVVIHKIDRSARNLKDWAELGEFIDQGVKVRFANEDLDLGSRSGRLSADLQAVLAADYIRNLREEVVKGFYGRLKQGFLPLPAPLGYLNQGAGKAKTIDPAKGPLVRTAFELYATGQYTFRTLQEEMHRRGLRNRRGGRLVYNGYTTLLRNPYYIGIMRLKRTGETFPGSHEPLIAKALFDRVQEVMNGRLSARPILHAFPFRKLFRCAKCGYAVIGEERKGHRYYRCHGRDCPRTIVREKDVDQACRERFHPLELTPEELSYVAAKVEEIRKGWATEADKAKELLRCRLGDLGARLERATDAYLDGVLEREAFEERKERLLMERRELEEKLAELEADAYSGLTKLERYLGLAKSAYSQYLERSPEEKRELVETLTSDRRVYGKRLEIALKTPFDLIARRWESTSGGPQQDIPRTWDRIIGMVLAAEETNRRSELRKPGSAREAPRTPPRSSRSGG